MFNETINFFELLHYLKQYNLQLTTVEDNIDLYSENGILYIKLYDAFNKQYLKKEAVVSKDWLDKNFIVLRKEAISNART